MPHKTDQPPSLSVPARPESPPPRAHEPESVYILVACDIFPGVPAHTLVTDPTPAQLAHARNSSCCQIKAETAEQFPNQ